MKEKLENLLENSYSPYSNYPVSCIIKTKDSQEFIGVNVENASFGATICAERSALLNAVANGYKFGDFSEIHIMNKTDKFSYPCFSCRQMLIEFMEPSTKVFLYAKNEIKELTLSDLTPYKFDKDSL